MNDLMYYVTWAAGILCVLAALLMLMKHRAKKKQEAGDAANGDDPSEPEGASLSFAGIEVSGVGVPSTFLAFGVLLVLVGLGYGGAREETEDAEEETQEWIHEASRIGEALEKQEQATEILRVLAPKTKIDRLPAEKRAILTAPRYEIPTKFRREFTRVRGGR